MNKQDLSNLKSWRKQHGLSQEKLARMAGIKLETYRKAELGRSKPIEATLSKLERAMSAVEAKTQTEKRTIPTKLSELKSWRQRFGLSQKMLSALSKISLATVGLIEAGRIRPHKKTLEKLADTIVNVESGAEVIKTPKRRAVVDHTAGQIRLSNIDIDLINLVLNMSRKKKIELLKTMM